MYSTIGCLDVLQFHLLVFKLQKKFFDNWKVKQECDSTAFLYIFVIRGLVHFKIMPILCLPSNVM